MGGSSVLMASHSTHFVSDKGPLLPQDETGCYICHAPGNLQCGPDAPLFDDVPVPQPLADTTVCDGCHSPNGAYNGVDSIGDSVGAKDNWQNGVYDGSVLASGKERWCAGCHDDVPANSAADGSGVDAPNIAGDNSTYGYYASGHGRNVIPLRGTSGWPTERIECLDCHDASATHIDGETRTYAYNSAYRVPAQSGVAYAAGYRLNYVDGEVPLMIPANLSITFGYNPSLMKDTAFRLCFSCHGVSKILDDTPGDGIDSNFKASLPNPPRNFSYAWGGANDEHNEHVIHIMMYTMEGWDSDWDIDTDGPAPGDGIDSLRTCSSCHNVHGAAGTQGSTNEVMIRDGSLSGRAGYGFSYVIEAGVGYPMVTSTGATQAIGVGAIMREGANDTCYGDCHGFASTLDNPYDATGSAFGTYLEWYRPWDDTHSGLSNEYCSNLCHSMR